MMVPKKECRSNKNYWVVSLGKKMTGSKRQRRYFNSRKEARAFIEAAEVSRKKLGEEAFILPMALRIESFLCWKRLQPLNKTLTEAVDFFLEYGLPQSQESVDIARLTHEFLESRKKMNCRPRTLIQYESYFRVINADLGALCLAKLEPSSIEDWIEESGWKPRTKKNYMVTLTTILNYALSKGYIKTNPAEGIARPIMEEKPVEILTVDQVNKLLAWMHSCHQDLVPAVTIGLFAGLRRSELFALDWSEINLEDGYIEVTAGKAKTRQRRVVCIQNNLKKWLIPFSLQSGPVCVDRHIDTFSDRLRKAAFESGIDPWPHNALRHSFGSYFLGLTRDENRTASEMGNSPQVVIKHYRAVVRDADVERYWNIKPM